MKKALLIEFFEGHGWLLYAHLRVLRRLGYDVTLAVNPVHRDALPRTIDVERVVKVRSGSFLQDIRCARIVAGLMRSTSFDVVIVNSCRSKLTRWMVLLGPRHPNMIGVHHNSHKLLRSASQRLISRRIAQA